MKILSINISLPKKILFNNKTLNTSIYKKPIDGKVSISKKGIEGDKQADLKSHGGVNKAVYAYSYNHYIYWGRLLKNDFSKNYGLIGENLTINNFDEKECFIGDQFQISNTVLQITQPRIPCYKLAIKMNKKDFLSFFTDYCHLGAYMKVIKNGVIEKGDDLRLIHRENLTMSIYEISKLLFHESDNIAKMKKALEIDCLSEEIKARFTSRLVKLGHYEII